MNIHARTGLTTQQMALRRARIADAARRAEAQRDLAQMFEGVNDERDGGNVGPENDAHIREVLRVVDNVVCAWGAHPLAALRARDVLTLIPEGVEVSCLGRTKGDAPKHPLYLRADTARVPFGGSRG